jgi:hypothetical protein
MNQTIEQKGMLELQGMAGKTSWSSDKVFFHGEKGVFLVDDGEHFRTYKSKSTVVHGVARNYIQQGIDEPEAQGTAKQEVRDREIDGHVQWAGSLAGHPKGVFQSIDGQPLLVLSSPKIPEPKAGACITILPIIKQAFPDDHQRTIFLGWLKGGYMAVKCGVHQPAPMLAIAGEANAGKSLISFIVKMMLGGRDANPLTAWSGKLPWNDHLVGAELLLLDDCQGSTDHRSRMEFASRFKSSIYGSSVEMNRRNNSSMTLRPVWRVMACMNDNPENLLILPPINSDTADKITLLKVSKIHLEIDTSTPDGKLELQREIESDLPAFAAMLEAFEIPEALRDTRAGIRAWQHPELLESIEQTKPETKLAEIILASFDQCPDLWQDLPRALTATEIESRLSAPSRATADQARKLLSWPAACGSYLSKLAKAGAEMVSNADPDRHSKTLRYHIRKP